MKSPPETTQIAAESSENLDSGLHPLLDRDHPVWWRGHPLMIIGRAKYCPSDMRGMVCQAPATVAA